MRLARTLLQEGVNLLGMQFEAIDLASNRKRFGAVLEELGLRSPPYGTATSVEEALKVAASICVYTNDHITVEVV